jgi:hypothetical protein
MSAGTEVAIDRYSVMLAITPELFQCTTGGNNGASAWLSFSRSWPFLELSSRPYARSHRYSADATGVSYVGKAYRHLGNRIWAHIGRQKRAGEKCEVYPTSVPWFRECGPDIAVWSVAVPENHWWLASALEGYMTEKLLPQKSRRF